MPENTHVRQARLLAGLSTVQVAERSGLDIAVVSKFERGVCGLTLRSLLLYAEAVGLDTLARELAPIVNDLPNEGHTRHGDGRRGRRSDAPPAEKWLRELLLESGGSATRSEVMAYALNDQIGSRSTVERAAKQLGVVRKTQGFGPDKVSTWHLPA